MAPTLAPTALVDDLQSIKDWVKTGSHPEHDAILIDLVNAATEELERETGRVYVQREVTERFLAYGQRRLTLSYPPVQSLSTFTHAGVALELADYWLDGERGVLHLFSGQRFRYDQAPIVVTYVAGYPRAEVPQTALRLVREMVKLWYDEWSAGAIAASQVSIGSSSMVIKPAWPYHIREAMTRLAREVKP